MIRFKSINEAREFIRALDLSCKRYSECCMQNCDICIARKLKNSGYVEAVKEVEEIMTVKELQLLSNNSLNALVELSRIKGKVTL